MIKHKPIKYDLDLLEAEDVYRQYVAEAWEHNKNIIRLSIGIDNAGHIKMSKLLFLKNIKHEIDALSQIKLITKEKHIHDIMECLAITLNVNYEGYYTSHNQGELEFINKK